MSVREVVGLGLALGFVVGGLSFVRTAIRSDAPMWLRYAMSCMGWLAAWLGALVILGVLT